MAAETYTTPASRVFAGHLTYTSGEVTLTGSAIPVILDASGSGKRLRMEGFTQVTIHALGVDNGSGGASTVALTAAANSDQDTYLTVTTDVTTSVTTTLTEVYSGPWLYGDLYMTANGTAGDGIKVWIICK